MGVAAQAARDGRNLDASRIYEQVLQLDPNHRGALRTLACLNEAAGDYGRAVDQWKRLVEVSPKDAKAHQDLGLALMRLGQRTEALAAIRRTIDLAPSYAPGHCNLGLVLEECRDFAGAAAALRQALALQPDSGFIAYHLAAVAAQAGEPHAVVKACPRDYLVPLFDGYADRFDAHLFQTLRYNGPQMLADIVGDVPTSEQRPLPWDVLDLGCGTGMTGVPFRSAARTITGVDLAPRMLERAARREMPAGRRVYDALLECDVVAALRAQQGGYDLVLSADVFIYVGDLQDVFTAVRSALRPGGLFAFTIEIWDGSEDFRLLPTRRYAQSPAYIANLTREADLQEVGRRSLTLRLGEGLEPVGGLVFLLKRPAETNETGNRINASG
ncbi:MAG TPA: methyltransferase domain-containing protein [Planctomycetaceae bacterium]|nr:methyltransferase domain-containing protein [Planctomycetaceae bacterium]